jgi:hypothetical protein
VRVQWPIFNPVPGSGRKTESDHSIVNDRGEASGKGPILVTEWWPAEKPDTDSESDHSKSPPSENRPSMRDAKSADFCSIHGSIPSYQSSTGKVEGNKVEGDDD